MKFFKTFVAAAAMIASAAAVALPQAAGADGPNMFTAPAAGGTTLNGEGVVNIAWTPGPPGTVSLWLTKGKEGAMIDLMSIAANIPNNGAFTWTPPTSLQDSSTITNGEQYGFRIVDDSSQATNYSPPFGLTVPGSTFQAAPTDPASPATTGPSQAASSAPATEQSSATPVSSAVTSAAATSAAPTTAPSAVPSAATSAPATTNTAATTTAASTKTQAPTASASATNSPATDDNDAPSKSDGPNIGVIIGAVFGSVAGIGLLAVAIMIFLRKRKEHQREQAIKNLDREHALQRVSEVQREWMSQYEQQPTRTPSNAGLSVNGQTEKRRTPSFMGTAF